MNISTGQTIFEQVLSLDADNNPVTGATFNYVVYNNGVIDSGGTIVDIGLVDPNTGVFTMSWSASNQGNYQIFLQNTFTNVIFITDTVSVLPDSYFDENIYIGL